MAEELLYLAEVHPAAQDVSGYAIDDQGPTIRIVMEETGIRRLCCWTHGKRSFKLFEDDDPVVKTLADAIRALYHIEHDADRAIASAHASGQAAVALRYHIRRD